MNTERLTKISFDDLNEDQKNLFRQAEQEEFYSEIMELGYKLAIEDYKSSEKSNANLHVEDPKKIKDEEIEEAAKELGEIEGDLFVEKKSKEEDWELRMEMAEAEKAAEEYLEWQDAQALDEEIVKRLEAQENL